MDLGLHGHTALVTGSSGGIGAAIATTLAAEGAQVLVHGRDAAAAGQVVDAIRRTGGSASVVLADLSDDDEVRRLGRQAVDGEVDVLVANAGPFAEDDWSTVDVATWRSTYDGNVTAVALLVEQLLPSLHRRGWGRVITIGTRATVTPLATMTSYSAAKAALANLTVTLSAHLADTGVTANCVAPGVIATPSLQRMFLDRPEFEGRSWEDVEASVTADYAPNPVGRLGRPDDVASAVAFLAGHGADYITGATLRVDGGITGAL